MQDLFARLVVLLHNPLVRGHLPSQILQVCADVQCLSFNGQLSPYQVVLFIESEHFCFVFLGNGFHFNFDKETMQ